MNKFRSLGLLATIGGVVVLTGCVAAGPGYYGDGGYGGGYSQPYYDDPSPVIVPAPVYIQGGGYYSGGSGYRQPYYDGRGRPGPGYYGGRPGYAPRIGAYPPGAVPQRPVVVPQQRAGRPGSGPRPIVAPQRGPSVIMQPSQNNREQP